MTHQNSLTKRLPEDWGVLCQNPPQENIQKVLDYLNRTYDHNMTNIMEGWYGVSDGKVFTPWLQHNFEFTKLTNKDFKKYFENYEHVPPALLRDGYAAMNKHQRKLVEENVNAFTGETTRDFIKEYYRFHSCVEWKGKMEKAFPFLKEIDFSDDKILNKYQVFNKNGNVFNSLIYPLSANPAVTNKSLVLNNNFTWELSEMEDFQVLTPTLKKS